jgi:flagellar motility protein MotE (MotC chaperone)
MKRILKSSWMVILIGAVVYAGSTWLFWKTPAVVPVFARTAKRLPGQPMPSWDFVNPEADQLIAELRTEKEQVDKRKQELDELAVRLEAERSEINQVTQTVARLQSEFDKSILRVQTEETANLKKLAKMYASMAPDAAASIFGSLDDDAVVKILVYMKESEGAAILESMSKTGPAASKRAGALSERIRVAVFRAPTTAAP